MEAGSEIKWDVDVSIKRWIKFDPVKKTGRIFPA